MDLWPDTNWWEDTIPPSSDEYSFGPGDVLSLSRHSLWKSDRKMAFHAKEGVAIKSLHGERFRTSNGVAQGIVKEIAVLFSLRHPAICSGLGLKGRDCLSLYIEMKGGEMKPSKERSPRLIWKWFRDCYNGLDFLHRRGLVHLDVKPSNITVNNNGAFLIDFNLTSLLTIPPHHKKFYTKGYIPPEFLRGKSVDIGTVRADFWSLAVSFFHLASAIPVSAYNYVGQLSESEKEIIVAIHEKYAQRALKSTKLSHKVADDTTLADICRVLSKTNPEERVISYEDRKIIKGDEKETTPLPPGFRPDVTLGGGYHYCYIPEDTGLTVTSHLRDLMKLLLPKIGHHALPLTVLDLYWRSGLVNHGKWCISVAAKLLGAQLNNAYYGPEDTILELEVIVALEGKLFNFFIPYNDRDFCKILSERREVWLESDVPN